MIWLQMFFLNGSNFPSEPFLNGIKWWLGRSSLVKLNVPVGRISAPRALLTVVFPVPLLSRQVGVHRA